MKKKEKNKIMYEVILNNSKYLELVNQIDNMKFITDGKWDWEHGLVHYKRVANYVKTILIQLNENQRTIELGLVAALLHDIGLSESGPKKIDHAIKSSEMFRNFLVGTDINEEEAKIIEHAIYDHSKGNDIHNNIDLALLLADKLDVTYHRVINSSIHDEINKEYQKIKKVDIEINDNDLIVKYTVDGKVNLDILLEWDKIVTIPKKIAKYLDKNYIFKINDKMVDI